MDIERRDYPKYAAPAGAFHHSVRSGNLLFLAGSTARGTSAETGDIAAQTEVILDKFQHILEENGASLSNIVRVTSFVTDLREAPRRRKDPPKTLRRGLPRQHPGPSCRPRHPRHQDRD